MDKNKPQFRDVYFLTQILGVKVFCRGKKIGRLTDIVIIDHDKFPEVQSLFVSRPFGYPSLLIPFEKVEYMNAGKIIVDIGEFKNYERELASREIFLKDHVLDKKVLDIEDNDVEVVYDVMMVHKDSKLFVSDVDISKFGLFRRMGLKWLAEMIYPGYRNNKDIIPWSYIQHLPTDIGSFKGDVKLKVLKERLEDIPPMDLADILEELDHDQRMALFSELDTEQASDILEEIDPNVQRSLVASLKIERAGQLINEMTPGQAADVLSVLPSSESEALLKLLDPENRKKVESIMEQQEQKIINYATMDILNMDPEKTVGEVQDNYPKLAKGKDVIAYVYITDKNSKLIGIIGLKELLMADDSAKLSDVMSTSIVSLMPDSTLKEAIGMFMRYGHRALPVTDKNEKLLGVVSFRDIIMLKHKVLE